MKRILFLTLIIFCFSLSYGQSDNISATVDIGDRIYQDTLTTDIDTADVAFSLFNRDYNYYTITAFTDTGTDTVQVFTKAWNNSFWSQVGLRYLPDDTVRTTLNVTTASKEVVILDTEPYSFRLISTSKDGSKTIFLITGKKK